MKPRVKWPRKRFTSSRLTSPAGEGVEVRAAGGPLLDEQGRVTGVTVSNLRIQEASQGINYFVPAADVLSFLSLAPR